MFLKKGETPPPIERGPVGVGVTVLHAGQQGHIIFDNEGQRLATLNDDQFEQLCNHVEPFILMRQFETLATPTN